MKNRNLLFGLGLLLALSAVGFAQGVGIPTGIGAAGGDPATAFVAKVLAVMVGPLRYGISVIVFILSGITMLFSRGESKGAVAIALFAVAVLILGAPALVSWMS